MHEVDQDVVVMYILVKFCFDDFKSLRVFEGFEGFWFLSFLFEDIIISLKLEQYGTIKIRFGISDLDFVEIH